MNARHPTLIDILQPPRFAANPARAKATRTILQPEVDEFEKNLAAEGGAGAAKSPARSSGRRGTEPAVQHAV
jgi:hypothetical protein